jgi:2-keto-4-pentenoate hydratase
LQSTANVQTVAGNKGSKKLTSFSDPTFSGDWALDIAHRFVAARLAAEAMADYPGRLPPDMAAGYAVQEAAIELWRDDIAGWKVGLVPPALQSAMGTTRLSGPIFRRRVVHRGVGETATRLPGIPGGFAAIEVELVAEARADAPVGKTEWTIAEAATFACDWYLGVEFAASPLAAINDLGPTVVVSDFGNNNGLVVGPPLDPALVDDPARLICRTHIDCVEVGHASAASIPGGPLESLRFLLGHVARRDRPLRAGQMVSTGAITGVHQIFPGQTGFIEAIGFGTIEVIVVAATASAMRQEQE